MASALRLGLNNQQLFGRLACLQKCVVPCTSASTSAEKAGTKMDKYWKKNSQRNRPLSPHLSIYKYHIPMMLSISNRITASIVTGAFFAAPMIYLFGTKDFAGYYALLQNSGPLVQSGVTFAKLNLAFCFSFHFWASIRHFVWDTGKGYSTEQLYQTGYALLAATLLTTAGLMCL
ncbi:succinate dehydrogenase cytochrome b560 subunit, mitochondrial-like [Dreissena polymorpha]|uniref:succinate dehydrogenase cytochrome b560 subunit, mitochondrial-like n=1 Tax=Dreissena polymorpha TaxID=45954 RepID=UPI002263C302|nr:succinate dehydrogenase cytochrome b560 subunit, mitochondrial-like [Dreissena polymorpha]